MPNDVSTDDILSSAETVVARVCALSEIADIATRYLRAMDVGDEVSAACELVELRRLCEERVAWIEQARS